MADCKIVYYNSTTSSIQLGDFLYQNQAQTIPAGAGFYAWTNDDKWYQTDAEGVVISSGSCSPIGNIFTGGLAGSFLMGCITSSLSFGLVDNSWNDSYYTSSGNYSFVLWTGTGSRDTQNPAIQTTTASFQAYDFSFPYRYVGTTVDPAQQYNYGTILNTIGSGLTSTSASNELTAQIWGAINFNDTSSTYGYYSGSQIGLLEISLSNI